MSEHPSKQIVGSHGQVLRGKRIVLCVTGSVSAYLAPAIARELMRYGGEVFTFMTKTATSLVGPELMRWATGNPVVTELTGELEHVRMGSRITEGADLVLVAPASANTIAKAAAGIADNPVTAVILMASGSAIPLIIVPAMHEPMWANQALAKAVENLKSMGVTFVEPRIEEEKAKLADPQTVREFVIRALHPRPLPPGTRVWVSSGATAEHLDPVRVVTNLSSGKLGVAVAMEAFRRGAEVQMFLGHSQVRPPPYITVSETRTSGDLRKALEQSLAMTKPHLYFAVAAVADYKPAKPFSSKVDSRVDPVLHLDLEATEKVLPLIKELSPSTVVVAFKAEHGVEEAELVRRAEMLLGEADIVYATDISLPESSFGSDTSSGVMVTGRGQAVWVRKEKKEELAARLLNAASLLIGRSQT